VEERRLAKKAEELEIYLKKKKKQTHNSKYNYTLPELCGFCSSLGCVRLICKQ